MEIWKTIKGFSEYEVSSLGRVKSLKKTAKHVARSTHAVTERILPEKILKRMH